jgi:hypothetical protein
MKTQHWFLRQRFPRLFSAAVRRNPRRVWSTSRPSSRAGLSICGSVNVTHCTTGVVTNRRSFRKRGTLPLMRSFCRPIMHQRQQLLAITG